MLYFFWLDAELAGEQTRKNGGMALAGRLHVAAQDQLVTAGKRNRGLLHRQAPVSNMKDTPMPRSSAFRICAAAC
jgi:hypothetical protein